MLSSLDLVYGIKQIKKSAWLSFTIGVESKNHLPVYLSLHQQIHIYEKDRTEGFDSGSIFVSLSLPEDPIRSPDDKRTRNISTHISSDYWFERVGQYDDIKKMFRNRFYTYW